MNCENVLAEVMGGRRDGAIEAHLAVCPSCRGVVAAVEALGERLADPMLWEEPPGHLEEAVVAAVVGERPGPNSRKRIWWSLSAAAVVAVVVATAAWLGSRPDWEIELVAGPESAAATATVLGWNTPSGTRMVLEVEGLEAAAGGEYYELWLSAPDGRRVSAGTFADSGRFDVNVAVARAEYPRVWVTREPTGESGEYGGAYGHVVLDSDGG